MARPAAPLDIDSWPYHALQAEAAKHSIRRNLGAAKLRQALKQTRDNNGSTADLPREWLIQSSSTAPGPSRPLPPPKPAARLKRPHSRIGTAAPDLPEPIRPTVPAPAKPKTSVQKGKPAEPAAPKTENLKRPIRPKPTSSLKDSKLPRKPLHVRPKQVAAVPGPSGPSITVRKKTLPPKASSRPIDPEPIASQGLAQALRREAANLGFGDLISSANLADLVHMTQRILQSLGRGTSLLDAVLISLPTELPHDSQPSSHSPQSMYWEISNGGFNQVTSIHSGNSRDSLGPRVGLGRYVSTPARSGDLQPPAINLPGISTTPPDEPDISTTPPGEPGTSTTPPGEPVISTTPAGKPPQSGEEESDDDEHTQSEIESMLIPSTSPPLGSMRRRLAQMKVAQGLLAESEELGPLRKKARLAKEPAVDKASGLTRIDEARESGSSAPSQSRQTSSGPDVPTAGPSGRRPTGARALDLPKLSLFPTRKTTGARLLEKPKPDPPSTSPISRPTLFGTENLYGDTTAQPFGEMFERAGRYGGFLGNIYGESGSSSTAAPKRNEKK